MCPGEGRGTPQRALFQGAHQRLAAVFKGDDPATNVFAKFLEIRFLVFHSS